MARTEVKTKDDDRGLQCRHCGSRHTRVVYSRPY